VDFRRGQVGGFRRGLKVVHQQVLVEVCLRDQGEVCRPAPVVDYRPARAEDFQRDQVGDYLPDRKAVFQQVQAEDCRQDLAADCLRDRHLTTVIFLRERYI